MSWVVETAPRAAVLCVCVCVRAQDNGTRVVCQWKRDSSYNKISGCARVWKKRWQEPKTLMGTGWRGFEEKEILVALVCKICKCKSLKEALAGWLSWLEHCPVHQKGCGFDSQSEHMPGLRVWSQWGHVREATLTSMSQSLSPPSSLSESINTSSSEEHVCTYIHKYFQTKSLREEICLKLWQIWFNFHLRKHDFLTAKYYINSI